MQILLQQVANVFLVSDNMPEAFTTKWYLCERPKPVIPKLSTAVPWIAMAN